MLKTFLTRTWGLKHPVVGAPIAGVARGRLARAVSDAGGLGMIGVGSTAALEMPAREAAVAREGDPDRKFGIGMMGWSIDQRPELLDACIAARPFVLSISFGLRREWVDRAKAAGIHVVSQVQTRALAIEAAGLGVDAIVAQGTEAGGHSGSVGTLPLLQIVLENVKDVPVLAAGGIASPRGVAAVLAAGAQGAWVGTVLVATPDGELPERFRRRVVDANETQTVLTHVFDWAGGYDWPQQFAGRALVNDFARKWLDQEDALKQNPAERQRYQQGEKDWDIDVKGLYAGQAVGLVHEERRAADVIRWLGQGAEEFLRARTREILG